MKFERPDDPFGTPASRSAPPVQFTDARGDRWSVQERDTRREPGARAESCLVFSGENAIRRVWIYPADWATLSPTELEALGNRP